MKKLSLLLLVLNGLTASSQTVWHLRTEHMENPIGIDFQQLRFSWLIKSEGKSNLFQESYQLSMRSEDGFEWNSGWVKSGRNYLVHYNGPTLDRKTRYYWRVKIKTNKGVETEFSEEARFEISALTREDWKGQWISLDREEDGRKKNPAHYYRIEFEPKKKVKKARLYASAHGLYTAWLDGDRIGDQELAPGWTTYKKRLQYQTYAIAPESFPSNKKHCLAFVVSDGWHRGRINYRGKDDPFKEDLALLAQLELTYEDGTIEYVATDTRWKANTGGLREATIYDGEHFDQRLEPIGWKKAGFPDRKWGKTIRAEQFNYESLIGMNGPKTMVQERLNVRKVWQEGNSWVFDFGQNLSGRLYIKYKSQDGDSITIEHAEVLDKDGKFYTDNLRSARARLCIHPLKQLENSYRPLHSFMGFRYVKISGLDTSDIRQIQAEVLHSEMEKRIEFDCSDSLLNTLYRNIIWGQKGNFLDVPTDCPQRDERMGWTGDAQVFASTAILNMNVAPFFRKWLEDLAAEQYEDGAVPWVVPNVFTGKRPPATGWADAATIIPWTLFDYYRDSQLLAANYPSMKAWVEFMINQSDSGLWFGERHFGDWLSYNPDDDRIGKAAVTEKELLAQIFYLHSTDLVIKASAVLNKDADNWYFKLKRNEAHEAFYNEFVTPNGRLVSGTQTAYTLALAYGLFKKEDVNQAVDRLVKNIHEYGHISSGFLGTPHLCRVLSEHGHVELAYRLLMRKEYPSWLYPVTRGATTIWERWDGIREDSSFQEASMNSFNHYAYGAIGTWMVEEMAGLSPADFSFQPNPDSSLSFAHARHLSPYGWMSSRWDWTEDSTIKIRLEVPPNCQMRFVMPDGFDYLKAPALPKGNELNPGIWEFELVRKEKAEE